MTTGRPSAFSVAPVGRPFSSVTTSTSARMNPLLLAAIEFAVEGRDDDHALGQQVGEQFAEVADQDTVATSSRRLKVTKHSAELRDGGLVM